jgi:hypothetical protein
MMFFWLKNQFTDSVMPEFYTNGAPITPAADRYFLGNYNRVVGGVRILQVRVSADTGCTVDSNYANIITHCYPEYSSAVESREAFGPNKMWTWSSADELDESWYQGKNSFYSGSGFRIDVPLNYTQMVKQWDFLASNLYVVE